MGRRVIKVGEGALPATADNTNETMSRAFEPGANPPANTVVQQASDDYASKLIKYIPAEIVAAYVTIQGILEAAMREGWIHWAVFFVLLVLTPLYIWRVTTEPGKPVAVWQIVISTVSFLIWVFALGGPFEAAEWYDKIYGALILPIFTLAVPIMEPRK